MSALEAKLRLDRGRFTLDVDIEVQARGVTGLFGPSGSGKSTALRCLAGLERGASGVIRLGEEVWQDSATGRFLPAHRRGVGYVFQEADLFPHLSVCGNLEYAYRRAPERRVEWNDAIDWLELAPLLDRSPRGLSGGERQRAAIGRALLASPRLLLMDEPLSALDEVGRREIFPYLETLPGRLDIPLVYVSHSLRELLRLADRMIWLVDGRVVASGPPAEVVADPGFALWQGEEAAAVVEAVVREHDDHYGLTVLDGPWGPIRMRRHPIEPGRRVRIQIRAGDVSLSLGVEETTSILNQFPLRVDRIDEGGEGETLVRLVGGDTDATLLARITRLSRDRLGLAPGAQVWARVKSVAVVE